MRRREFIAGLGAAAALPVAARGQQPTVRTIGYLAVSTLERTRDIVSGVQKGLAETGFVEGKNVAVEYRWAEFQPERLAGLAADLVDRKVELIIMISMPRSGVVAISKSTPIVFFVGSDPVAAGLVASLNKPGGNITGVTVLNIEVIGKRLEILRELVPETRLIAYLGTPVSLENETKALQIAAQALGLQLRVLNVAKATEFDNAFASMAREKIGGVVVGNDVLLQRNSEQIAALAARHRIPAIYAGRISVAAGGLASYGTYYPEGYRIIGSYAGRILNGEKPADLPVQQLSRVELVVNLSAAKTLGISIPPTLLARADEVIE